MTNSLPTVPCRLFVILARAASTAVVFRRGPSKWVQVIRWDTDTDTFTSGQWFHGRIYEKRCDLSPDGTKLIYFAQKINARSLKDKEYTYAWTAISKMPYLTALALWPKGDCWDGGGLFWTEQRVWLNHPPGQTRPHKSHKPHGLTINHNQGVRGEDEPIYYRRLHRDGWRHVQEWRGEFIKSGFQRAFEERMRTGQGWNTEEMVSLGGLDTTSGYVTYAPGIHERRSPDQQSTLVMTTMLEGFHDRHDFHVRTATGQTQTVEGAIWADWDQRGRLVFARDGRLFAAKLDGSSVGEAQELADFNAAKPEQKETPDWAKKW